MRPGLPPALLQVEPEAELCCFPEKEDACLAPAWQLGVSEACSQPQAALAQGIVRGLKPSSWPN